MVEPKKNVKILHLAKEYWQQLVFIGTLFTVLFTFWGRVIEIYETPYAVASLNKRIDSLEYRIRQECKHVGKYHEKDYDSLLKMAKQRQKELREQRDKYFSLGKNSESDPVFVTLKDMETEWYKIMTFLEEERRWYGLVALNCLEHNDPDKAMGDAQ